MKHRSVGLPSGRRAMCCTVAGGLLMLASATPAWAQHWHLHGAAALVTAYTDNANGGGDSSPRDPVSSFYYRLRPSLAFAYETPRAAHMTVLSAEAVDYLRDDPALATSLDLSLTHGSRLALRPQIELGLGATAMTGHIRSNLGQAGQAPADLAQGDAAFERGDLFETMTWRPARAWRFSQGLASQFGRVDSEQDMRSSTGTATLTLGMDRTWARTALGITGQAGYIGITRSDPGSAERTRQVKTTMAATMRRRITPRWTAGARAGVATLSTVQSPDVMRIPETTHVTPAFLLTAHYLRRMGSVDLDTRLTASRTYAANILLGTTTEATGVVFTAALPLPWFRRDHGPIFRLSATGAWEHARVPGLAAASWNSVTADLATTFHASESWDITLRYQYLGSMVDPDAAMSGAPVPAGFTRNTLLLQVSGRFPGHRAATRPRHLLPVNQQFDHESAEPEAARYDKRQP